MRSKKLKAIASSFAELVKLLVVILACPVIDDPISHSHSLVQSHLSVHELLACTLSIATIANSTELLLY